MKQLKWVSIFVFASTWSLASAQERIVVWVQKMHPEIFKITDDEIDQLTVRVDALKVCMQQSPTYVDFSNCSIEQTIVQNRLESFQTTLNTINRVNVFRQKRLLDAIAHANNVELKKYKSRKSSEGAIKDLEAEIEVAIDKLRQIDLDAQAIQASINSRKERIGRINTSLLGRLNLLSQAEISLRNQLAAEINGLATRLSDLDFKHIEQEENLRFLHASKSRRQIAIERIYGLMKLLDEFRQSLFDSNQSFNDLMNSLKVFVSRADFKLDLKSELEFRYDAYLRMKAKNSIQMLEGDVVDSRFLETYFSSMNDELKKLKEEISIFKVKESMQCDQLKEAGPVFGISCL